MMTDLTLIALGREAIAARMRTSGNPSNLDSAEALRIGQAIAHDYPEIEQILQILAPLSRQGSTYVLARVMDLTSPTR